MAYIEELQQAERRLSAMINARAEREELQLREDRAECMRAEREQAREDAERRREIQARYADSFSAFGTLVPPPLDNERPGRYRQRLFDSLQHKLPPNHDLAMVRSDELSSAPARRNFEQMLLEPPWLKATNHRSPISRAMARWSRAFAPTQTAVTSEPNITAAAASSMTCPWSQKGWCGSSIRSPKK
jgi:hypothetical protein